MKETLKRFWDNFMDSGIPSILFYIVFFSLVIWKPILLLWLFAAIGVYAVIMIIGANFTGG